MSTTTVEITERVALGAGKVDEAAGIIRGVKVLGEKSSNGRRYRKTAMKEAASTGLYEDTAINVDHKSESADQRGWSERIATLKNVQYVEGQTDSSLTGDLHVRKSHPLYSMLMEDAKESTFGVGLSHSIRGRQEKIGGIDEITNIESVVSVDLVQNPATTKSLFEQAEKKPMKQSITQFAKSLKDSNPAKKSLLSLGEKHTVIELELDEAKDESEQLQLITEAVVIGQGNAVKTLEMLAFETPTKAPEKKPAEKAEEANVNVSESEWNAIRVKVEGISEAVELMVKESQARKFMQESGVEFSSEILSKLSEANDVPAMEALIAEMPQSVLRPSSRPILENISTSGPSEYKEGLQNFLSEVRATC